MGRPSAAAASTATPPCTTCCSGTASCSAPTSRCTPGRCSERAARFGRGGGRAPGRPGAARLGAFPRPRSGHSGAGTEALTAGAGRCRVRRGARAYARPVRDGRRRAGPGRRRVRVVAVGGSAGVAAGDCPSRRRPGGGGPPRASARGDRRDQHRAGQPGDHRVRRDQVRRQLLGPYADQPRRGEEVGGGDQQRADRAGDGEADPAVAARRAAGQAASAPMTSAEPSGERHAGQVDVAEPVARRRCR